MAPIEKVVFTSQDEVTAALINGEIDAMLADSPVTGFAIKLSRGELEPAGDVFDSAPYGWPVAKGSALAESLRQALERLMSTDEYRTIATMWGVEKGMIDKPVINGAMRRSSPYQGLVPRRVAWAVDRYRLAVPSVQLLRGDDQPANQSPFARQLNVGAEAELIKGLAP